MVPDTADASVHFFPGSFLESLSPHTDFTLYKALPHDLIWALTAKLWSKQGGYYRRFIAEEADAEAALE